MVDITVVLCAPEARRGEDRAGTLFSPARSPTDGGGGGGSDGGGGRCWWWWW